MKKNYVQKKGVIAAIFLFAMMMFYAHTALAQCASNDASTAGIVPTTGWWTPGGGQTIPCEKSQVKIDPVEDGIYALGTGTVTIKVDNTGNACGPVVSWVASGVKVYKVAVKGGKDANMYVYDGTVLTDGNLHAPLNPNGKYAGLSHLNFCFEPNVDPPSCELKFICPPDAVVDACDPDAENTPSEVFDLWKSGFKAEGTNNVKIAFYVDGNETDFDDIMLPEACGGSIKVVAKAWNDCPDSEVSCTKTFTILAPAPVELSAPEYKTMEKCLTQAEVDNAFAVWLEDYKVSGGCNTDVSNDAPELAPGKCGGTVTVTWTATSDCEGPVIKKATFTVPAPDAVELTAPADLTVDKCLSQDEVQTKYYDWLLGVTVSGGCNTDVSNDAPELAPDKCGGTVTVTWTATSDCEKDVTASAIFTVPVKEKPVIKAPADHEVLNTAPPTLGATWKDECGEGVLTATGTTTDGCRYNYTFTYNDGCNEVTHTTSVTVYTWANCQTGFARGGNETGKIVTTPFCGNAALDRWGWGSRIDATGTYTMPIYTGAGQCDITKGTLVGNVIVNYNKTSGTVTVKYVLTDNTFALTQAHLYLSNSAQYPKLGKAVTVAPGQYTYKNAALNYLPEWQFFTTPVSMGTNGFWVIAHAVVCKKHVCGAPVASSNPKSAIIPPVETSDAGGMLMAYPNPFSSKVNFEFTAKHDSHAVLEISNMLGQKISTLFDSPVKRDVRYRFEFEPKGEISGMYIYRMFLDGETRTGKLIYRK